MRINPEGHVEITQEGKIRSKKASQSAKQKKVPEALKKAESHQVTNSAATSEVRPTPNGSVSLCF